MAETHQFDVSKLFSVRDFVAVITGGGTGIGLMAAQALSANGAKVYITGRRTEVLENAARSHQPGNASGGRIIPVGPCDVTDKNDLERLATEIGRRERFIHLLVCNAGIAGPKAEPDVAEATDLKTRLWENEDLADWRANFDTNVTAVYFTTVAFLPLLQAGIRPRGPLEPYSSSVITISSMSGIMRRSQGHFSYNTAKGATVQLTKLMSSEFLKASIRVNSIAPGYFPPCATVTAKSSDERQKSYVPPEKIQDTGHVPLMRAGREEEMGMTVLYLAKNQYVNGEIIAVDGGTLNVLAGR